MSLYSKMRRYCVGIMRFKDLSQGPRGGFYSNQRPFDYRSSSLTSRLTILQGFISVLIHRTMEKCFFYLPDWTRTHNDVPRGVKVVGSKHQRIIIGSFITSRRWDERGHRYDTKEQLPPPFHSKDLLSFLLTYPSCRSHEAGQRRQTRVQI